MNLAASGAGTVGLAASAGAADAEPFGLRIDPDAARTLADRIATYFDGALDGRTVALWGLAASGHAGRLLGAPGLELIERLTAAGANVHAFDPARAADVRRLFAGNARVRVADRADDALEGADVLAVLGGCSVLPGPDLGVIARRLEAGAIFDGCDRYQPLQVRAAGLRHVGIGRAD